MLKLEEGGESPAPADSTRGSAALSARGAGRGPRAPGAAEQTKDAPHAAGAGPSRLLLWAASATWGGESALGSFPALLNNGAPSRSRVGTGLEPPRWARATAARMWSSALPLLPKRA